MNQSSSASVQLLHALFYEKKFLLASCKILEQLYATLVVAQISRQRDVGQAERRRLAQQSMMQYVSKDSRRFSLGHAWSKTWKTQRGRSSGTAACGWHLEIRFGSRDKREDSVRFKQMIASGWDGLWARWRDRL